MAITIDDYRCKLINKILLARSEQEVNRFIEFAIHRLKEIKVHGHIIARFIEKSMQQLDEFESVSQSLQQWNNIKAARIKFNQLKHFIHDNGQL